MPYCTQSDLEARIGSARLTRLADLDGDGSLDSAVLDDAIARADALIDLHLRTRYALPLSSVPGAVRDLSCDLSLYFLHAARRETMSPRDRQLYDDAVAILRGIAEGRGGLDLGIADAGASESALPAVTPVLSGSPPLFRPAADGTSGLDDF